MKVSNIINISAIRGIFIILLMSFATCYTTAQDYGDTIIISDDESMEVLLSSEKIPPIIPDFRVPGEEKIIEYQKDKRFQYERETENEEDLGILDRIVSWIMNFIDRLFSAKALGGTLGIVVIIVIIILLVLIILKIAGVKFHSIFGRQKLDTPEVNIYSENVHEMDFDTLIDNALKNKDYRLAIRFMYLKNLKKLTDNKIIDWRLNKTNHSYQHEIKDDVLRNKFLNTSLIFDYIWYGEFPINEMIFTESYNELSEFNTMIGG